MNWTLYIPAQNCCDINVCKTSCMIIGYPTLLGFTVFILFVIFIAFLLTMGPEIIDYIKGKIKK